MNKAALLKSLKKHKYLLTLVVLSLFTAVFTRFYIKQGLSGDEPHYLVMAQSLKNDHELNVKNNYAQKTYTVFYKDALEPHINWALFTKSSDTWYSIHGAGLAILLMPSMYIGNRFGPLLIMIMVSLLVIIQVFRLGKMLVNERAGFAASLVLLSSITFLSLSGYIFPDMVLGLLVVSVFCSLIQMMTTDSNRDRIVVGLLSGIMIWIHVKSALIAITYMGIAAILLLTAKEGIHEKVKKFAALIIPFLVVYLVFTLKIHEWYGIYLPNQMYKGNGQMLQLFPLSAIAAMLFDGFKGLFILNPALLLMFVGLPIWYKQNKQQVLIVLVILLPSFIAQSTFNDWGGGWGPPARYMMMYIPLLMGSIAFVYRAALKDRIVRWAAFAFVAAQIILTSLYVVARTTWGSIGTEAVFYNNVKTKFGISIPYLRATFNAHAIANNRGVVTTAVMIALIVTLMYIGYHHAYRLTKNSH